MLSAQDRRPVKENVEAMKIGFITERLELTPEEAQKFWPIYNQYTEETNNLRKTRRKNMSEAKENMDEMTEADAEKFIDNELALKQEELDIQKKYHPQLKKVLSSKKIAKLYRSEDEFKRRLLEMIKEKRDGKQAPLRRR
jgi:Spy/CpxP family protein refolding chaperone